MFFVPYIPSPEEILRDRERRAQERARDIERRARRYDEYLNQHVMLVERGLQPGPVKTRVEFDLEWDLRSRQQ